MKKLSLLAVLLISGFILFNLQAQGNAYLLGQLAFENKDYKQAVILLNKHLDNFPNHHDARLLRAKSLLNSSDYVFASEDLARLKLSGNYEIFLLQSRAYAGLGNTKLAIEKLEQYRNTGNKISDQIIKAYPEFQTLKNSKEWAILWQNWNYSEKELAFINAGFALKSERYAEAADRLDTYLSRYKTNAEAYYIRGNLYDQARDYKNALTCYENAVRISNSEEFRIAKAFTLSKLKKDKYALEEFNFILKDDSLAIKAYLGRAEALMNLNKLEEAISDISNYLSYYPGNTDALFIEATIRNKSGDYLGAISGFGKLIKADPSKPAYFIGRADAYASTKTYVYAIKDYSMALDLDPKNVEVYKRKANAALLAGDLNAACTDWNHAVRLGDIESIGLIQRYCKGK